jgi:hypothetical protein
MYVNGEVSGTLIYKWRANKVMGQSTEQKQFKSVTHSLDLSICSVKFVGALLTTLHVHVDVICLLYSII